MSPPYANSPGGENRGHLWLANRLFCGHESGFWLGRLSIGSKPAPAISSDRKRSQQPITRGGLAGTTATLRRPARRASWQTSMARARPSRRLRPHKSPRRKPGDRQQGIPSLTLRACMKPSSTASRRLRPHKSPRRKPGDRKQGIPSLTLRACMKPGSKESRRSRSGLVSSPSLATSAVVENLEREPDVAESGQRLRCAQLGVILHQCRDVGEVVMPFAEPAAGLGGGGQFDRSQRPAVRPAERRAR